MTEIKIITNEDERKTSITGDGSLGCANHGDAEYGYHGNVVDGSHGYVKDVNRGATDGATLRQDTLRVEADTR